MLANDQLLQAHTHKLGLLSLLLVMAMANSSVHAATPIPVCKILSPHAKAKLTANHDVEFTAKVTSNDHHLSYEWDFGGGSMGERIPGSNPPAYKRPTSLNATIQFVRNDATYRVHFSATDSHQRRCDAAVDVVVGHPPRGLPNSSALVKASQKNAPKLGSQLAGNPGDLVVLPYPDLTMQAHSDARYQDNLYVPVTPGSFNTLNALVYEKARKPKKITDSRVIVRYQAASSKNDPVGVASINTTSQNYPGAKKDVLAPFENAQIQKTDIWEAMKRPASAKLADGYMAMSWMDNMPNWDMHSPDQGFAPSNDPANGINHSSYMPGSDNPFVSNDFKDFKFFTGASHSFTAQFIPITDIDDAGKVNPYPLLRVQAFDKKTNRPIANATVDTVVTAAKDFNCRECHAKGKIAAPDKNTLDFSTLTKAYRSSSEYNNGYSCIPGAVAGEDCSDRLMKGLGFYDAVDKNGKASDGIADQEYAAVRNALALHDFYDNTGMNWFMDNGSRNADGTYAMDMNGNCGWCHNDLVNSQFGWGANTNAGNKAGDLTYYPNFSQAIHGYHGKLQLDPQDKGKILRNADGRPALWDLTQGSNPNSLFPTVDGNGKSLPMEQSCLRCHSGHREQLYRDRMYTAGVTCFDCHGDMAAVGQVHTKPKAGPEGSVTRLNWLDQPDCGSCHMGDANVGNSSPDAFSAGVMKRAFDLADQSATARPPMTQRFAVQPTEALSISKDDWVDPQYSTRHSLMTVSKPLYRTSRDKHGDVACAACHGGAHEIAANRDPKANDNVTALQLQGHTGTILECNVCHSADAFKNERDLDGGSYMTDVAVDSGVLGGPHNMHPVNDPYWWQSSQNSNDTNTDGSLQGGWHNNYAKTPGKNGEDQCAACHGNDHKGTRLSKTPVDRVFTFKGDAAKLKAAGFKATTIKVAAGTVIGCDTCHSIKTSCNNSPAGDNCGVASTLVAGSGNHDPVITSKPSQLNAVFGEDFSYPVQASDQDHDYLTYTLGSKPATVTDAAGNRIDMQIDSKGLLSVKWVEQMFADYKHGPFRFPFTVSVSDGKGGYAVQNLEMMLDCPAGKAWQWSYGAQWYDSGEGSCVDKTAVSITSTSPVAGINAGDQYLYTVTANDISKQGPLKYSIVPWPDGMRNAPIGIGINEDSGVINWTATTVWYGQAFFKVKASNSQGVSDEQLVTLTVCVPSKQWDAATSQCIAK